MYTTSSIEQFIHGDTMANITFHKQETCYTCGAAAMRMALEACGVKRSEKQVVKLLATNKVRGSWHKNFPVVAERFLLDYVVRRNATIDDLKQLMKEGYVVVVCYFYPPEKVDHYSVIRSIGKDGVAFWDPWWGPEHKLPLPYFRENWKSDPRYDDEKGWLIALKKPQS
jgi:predicted double-glycine peptidase